LTTIIKKSCSRKHNSRFGLIWLLSAFISGLTGSAQAQTQAQMRAIVERKSRETLEILMRQNEKNAPPETEADIIKAARAPGYGLSFLNDNPELKEELLRWEQEAPENVKHSILRLRGSKEPVTRGNIAGYLLDKGAILVLLETALDRAPLKEVSDSYNIVVGWTSPAFEAIKSLQRIGEPAVEPLIAALTDQNWQVREIAVKALGKIGDPRAKEPLLQARQDQSPVVRNEAKYALEKNKWDTGIVITEKQTTP